jgi:hypothetical protein
MSDSNKGERVDLDQLTNQQLWELIAKAAKDAPDPNCFEVDLGRWVLRVTTRTWTTLQEPRQ